jgi:putative Ca2+/H+ antiporter (TMEM165/GDT1 family)
VFVLALGEQTQFFTFALAASGKPWFAAAGSTLGALVVAMVAALLGAARWNALPLRWLRFGAAAIFLVAGAVIALDALRLLD